MKFKKQYLLELIENPKHEEITDTSRWSIHYRAIFEHEGKFYATDYSRGATEAQCEEPYEYSPDDIECPEVQLVEKIVLAWEPVATDSV